MWNDNSKMKLLKFMWEFMDISFIYKSICSDTVLLNFLNVLHYISHRCCMLLGRQSINDNPLDESSSPARTHFVLHP
jgi:hypothetical protein